MLVETFERALHVLEAGHALRRLDAKLFLDDRDLPDTREHLLGSQLLRIATNGLPVCQLAQRRDPMRRDAMVVYRRGWCQGRRSTQDVDDRARPASGGRCGARADEARDGNRWPRVDALACGWRDRAGSFDVRQLPGRGRRTLIVVRMRVLQLLLRIESPVDDVSSVVLLRARVRDLRAGATRSPCALIG